MGLNKQLVSIVKYEQPFESVRRACELCRGLDHLPQNAKVFIKPNIVFWTKESDFPKYGVITTSRVIEDMIVMLRDRGINKIMIGEGTVLADPKDKATQSHAFQSLGYDRFKRRYGVETVNVWERPFAKIDLGDDVVLNFNIDVLDADFVVDLPVLKTHSMTRVSLGIKNLKGLIDIKSRKKCHNTDPIKDLHFMVAKLADKLPPMFTLLDGIFTSECGPNIDGIMHRSNLLIASADVLSADMVGSKVLGYEPEEIPHLVHAAANRKRPIDLSDVEVRGEAIESVASFHQYDFPYNQNQTLPLPMEQMGIQGLSYYKFDLSLCTYCSEITRTVLYAIAKAWKGKPWPDVEVLSGKMMEPRPGKKKTILFGKCMYQAHKNHPNIQEMIPVKGCPPKPESIIKALHQAGIDADPSIFKNIDKMPAKFLKRYENKPEFDNRFFRAE